MFINHNKHVSAVRVCTEQAEQFLTITSCHVKLEVENETGAAGDTKPRDGQALPVGNIGGKEKRSVLF